MEQPERFQVGNWHFAVRPRLPHSNAGYLAWCAKNHADTGDHPLDIPAEVEVHRAFGATRDEAVEKLKAELAVSAAVPPPLYRRIIGAWPWPRRRAS